MIPGSSKQRAILKNEQMTVAHPTGPLLQCWWSFWAFAGLKKHIHVLALGSCTHQHGGAMGCHWALIRMAVLFEEPGENVNDNTEWSLASSSPYILDAKIGSSAWSTKDDTRAIAAVTVKMRKATLQLQNPPHVVNFKLQTAIKLIMFLGFVQCSIYHQTQLAKWLILWEARGTRILRGKLELWKILDVWRGWRKRPCCP